MNNRIPALAVLLIVQLLLVAFFLLDFNGDQRNEVAWLSVEPDVVDEIVISDAETEVVLSKSGGEWRAADLPADAEKISDLLEKLREIKSPWPVATSGGSRERFEVTSENHQRRIQLKGDGEIQADLLLGTSPGFQRVHARLAAQDEIYSIELSNYELPTTADGWMDKGMLGIGESLEAITLKLIDGSIEHHLTRSDEGWLYNGEAADQAAANTYAGRFENLQVLNVASTDAVADATPLGAVELAWDGGGKTIEIAQHAEDYLLRENDQSFQVAAYIAEQLLLSDVDLQPQVEKDNQ